MNTFKVIVIIMFTISFLGTGYSDSQAFWGGLFKLGKTSGVSLSKKLGKVDGALPDSEITDLTKMIKEGGDIKKVGKVLGAKNLSGEVLEDTYMRITVKQGKIPKKEAEDLFQNLHGTEGFRTTLRKVAGVSEAKTSGHLNEIRIANSASKNGFEIMGIGIPFDDAIKSKPSDIDILMKKNGKIFSVEAKNYAPQTGITMDVVRKDMDTLNAYKKADKQVIPIFTMTNRPVNPNKLKLLEKEADRRGVQLIFGNPEEQMTQINQLAEIL